MKLLLLLAAMITLTANAQTSVYHPFPDSNATWCTSFCGNQGDAFSDATYQLGGQELINGNWYGKMLYYGRSCYGAGMCYCGALNYAGTTTYYIWQDTAQKKVWLYYPSTNSDTIFLDFDLHVGDTIDAGKAYWARYWSFGNFAIVSSIDSVLIGTQYRTRYNYDYSSFTNSMIEGIGPTHGFFNMANTGLDYMTSLNIFSQNNQVFYPFYSPDTIGNMQQCPRSTTGIAELNQTLYSIFPNPFHTTTTLKINLENAELKIYNALGEQVRQQTVRNKSTTIHRDGLRDGLYFFRVTNDHEILTSGTLIVE